MGKWVWIRCPGNIRHLLLLTWFSIVYLICNRQGRNSALLWKASHWRSQKKTSHLFSQGKHVSVRSHRWRKDEGCPTLTHSRSSPLTRALRRNGAQAGCVFGPCTASDGSRLSACSNRLVWFVHSGMQARAVQWTSPTKAVVPRRCSRWPLASAWRLPDWAQPLWTAEIPASGGDMRWALHRCYLDWKMLEWEGSGADQKLLQALENSSPTWNFRWTRNACYLMVRRSFLAKKPQNIGLAFAQSTYL